MNQRDVSGAYFSTLRAKLVRGRYFSDAEDASKPRVVVINQTFAQQHFAGEDPIGKRIGDTSLTPSSMTEIVGVVEDIREGTLEAEGWPTAYYPINQSPDSAYGVVARTSQAEESVIRTISESLRQIGPEVVTMTGMTMNERIPSFGAGPYTAIIGNACRRICVSGLSDERGRLVWRDRLFR